MSNRTLQASLIASLMLLGTSCSSLPEPPRTDAEGTALNASTSLWLGVSSNGSTSRVRQVSTGPNQFEFTETWYVGGKIIYTEGRGKYEPKSETNIYSYTKPEGVVVVKTTEEEEDRKTIDTVLNSTIDLFRPGEKIIYTKRLKPLE
jgi:hypothetical protein